LFVDPRNRLQTSRPRQSKAPRIGARPGLAKDQRRREPVVFIPRSEALRRTSQQDWIRDMFARNLTAFAAALLTAAPALAQAEAESVSVSTADLNLATATGRAQLNRRISRAADEVCDLGTGGLAERSAYQGCRADALTSANQQIASLQATKGGRIRLARNAR
jgi:UrcA family protein